MTCIYLFCRSSVPPGVKESREPTLILCSRSNLDSALENGGGDLGGEFLSSSGSCLLLSRPYLLLRVPMSVSGSGSGVKCPDDNDRSMDARSALVDARNKRSEGFRGKWGGFLGSLLLTNMNGNEEN